MRYETPIFFQKITRSYNASTGNYSESNPVETRRQADVTDTGSQAMQAIYGNVTQKSLTIRLNCYYNAPFDFIRVGNTRYKVDSQRNLQHKQIFIVSEA